MRVKAEVKDYIDVARKVRLCKHVLLETREELGRILPKTKYVGKIDRAFELVQEIGWEAENRLFADHNVGLGLFDGPVDK